LTLNMALLLMLQEFLFVITINRFSEGMYRTFVPLANHALSATDDISATDTNSSVSSQHFIKNSI
jgi:hypothetical protein